MAIKLVSNEKTAETSSKGNQEKWYNNMIRSAMWTTPLPVKSGIGASTSIPIT